MTRLTTRRVRGNDLAVGDSIVFLNQSYRVTALVPYHGLPDVFVDGARIAHVEGRGSFMTIDNSGSVDVAA